MPDLAGADLSCLGLVFYLPPSGSWVASCGPVTVTAWPALLITGIGYMSGATSISDASRLIFQGKINYLIPATGLGHI